MTSETLHIASFIIHARPEHLQGTADWLSTQSDCELRGEDASGKLVVVVESLQEQRVLELIDSAQMLPGVLGAALVYHQMLDPQTADEPQEI